MKRKMKGVLGVALTLMLLASLTVGIVTPATAADGSWSALSTPVAGTPHVLGPAAGYGPNVGPGPMEKAIDGTIYAYWNIGEGDSLYKSIDGARTWTRCSTTTDELLAGAVIIRIACSTQDANRLYVATTTNIYRSIDAGATFNRMLPPTPSPVAAFSCMDVGYNGGNHFIFIGTAPDSGNGDVWMLKDAFGESWTSYGFAAAGYTGRRVMALACSPNFATEASPQVIAVSYVIANNNAYVSFNYGGPNAWGGDNMLDEVYLTVDGFDYAIVAADIAFPDDYNSSPATRDFFIGVDVGDGNEGDVYRIVSDSDLRLNVRAGLGTNITSVACAGKSGDCKILAAGTSSNNVFHSEDCGVTWLASLKAPVCANTTTAKCIIMDKTYSASGVAWIAVAAGAVLDNASVAQTGLPTADFGATWTDLSMINTDIKVIENMDVSSSYTADKALFMVTSPTSGLGSVWKWDGTLGTAGYWTRMATLPAGNAATAIIRCSPDFFLDKTVFLANTATRRIYCASDRGFFFKPQISLVPDPFDGGMMVIDRYSLIVGSGTKATITTNNGTLWTPVTVTGATTAIFSFAKSPAYATDNTLLCGDSSGKVYISSNRGVSWTQIPAAAAAGTGNAVVGFDAKYATNNYIYAACAGSTTVTPKVYRMNAKTGTSWSSIDSSSGALSATRFVPGMQNSLDATLYVGSQTAAAGSAVLADAFIITDPVGGTTLAADAFTIIDPVGAPGIATADFFTITIGGSVATYRTGTITVGAGSVDVTFEAGVTVGGIAGPGTFNLTPVLGAVSWSGDEGKTITVTAKSADAAGTWTRYTSAPGATSTAVVTDNGDGDAFVSTTGGPWSLPDAVRPAGDSGFLFIATGSASVTTSGDATYNSGTGAWTTTTPAGGKLVVTATAANTTGSWSTTRGFAIASVTSDADLDASVVATGGVFKLPDITGSVPGDSGFIVVSSGSVSVTTSGGATYTASTGAWTTTTTAGGKLVVTATAANTIGTWSTTRGNAVAGISVDTDLDASVAATGGAFSLPDKAVSAPAGSNQVVLRSLTDTRTTFEPMSSGFSGTIGNLRGVWYNDGTPAGAPQLWVVLSTAGASKIFTYTDRLTIKPTLSSPADKAMLGRVSTATLSWSSLSTASKYEVQVSLQSTFSTLTGGTPTYISGTSLTLTDLTPGTTYYWRVRSAPVADGGKAMSPWATARSFGTGMVGAEWDPFIPAERVAPAPGASGVPLRPTFQWNPADYTPGYEFELSKSPATGTDGYYTTSLVSIKKDAPLTSSVYAYDKELALEYSTAYYWHVRAILANSTSNWANGVFTTMAKPVEPTPPVTIEQLPTPQVTLTLPPTQLITPAWIWAIVIIGAVLVIAVIVLIVTTRRVP